MALFSDESNMVSKYFEIKNKGFIRNIFVLHLSDCDNPSKVLKGEILIYLFLLRLFHFIFYSFFCPFFYFIFLFDYFFYSYLFYYFTVFFIVIFIVIFIVFYFILFQR